MGKIDNGILGGFNGKVGNVVGSTWKGISYMRAKAPSVKRKASDKQIAHRTRFRMASKFLQPLYPILEIGFKNLTIHRSPQNAAMAELMNYALDGEYPDFKINLDNVTLSIGTLKVPNKRSVVFEEDHIVFTWNESKNDQGNTSVTEALSKQGVIMVAIAEGAYPEYSINDYTREKGTGNLYPPEVPSGTVIHCYLAFDVLDESTRVSNSIHVGTVIMP